MMSEEYLLGVIEEIQSGKLEKHVSHTLALREELQKHVWEDIRKCLWQLLNGKKITYHTTLNSWGVQKTEER